MIYNESRYNSHWDTKKLNELGTFDRGKSKHRPRDDKKLFENGKYPLIQTGEVKAANLYIDFHNAEYGEFGLSQSKIWPTGTLCITIAANIAETALLGYPMCFPDSVIGFNAFPEKTSELFMHYVFTFIKKSIQNSTGGSIQDNINIGYLEELDFKIPSKPYQDKIVNVLSSIDKKIDLNNKINGELKKLIRTIYEHWFIQFEYPNSESKPYKTSGGIMVWNSELKINIPEGLTVCDLNRYVLLQTNSFNPKTEPNSLVEHYSIPAYDVNKIPIFEYSKGIGSNKYKVNKDDILVSKLNPRFSRVWKPYCLSDKAICSTEFMVYKIKNINLMNYCHSLFLSRHFQTYLISQETGSTGSRKRVEPEVSLKYKVVEFSENTLQKFGEIVDPYLKTIMKNLIENEKLINFRDWLLPMLMTGQVTFK